MKFRDLWRLSLLMSLLGAALLAALASAGGSGCGPEKGKLGQPCAYASEGTSFFDGDYYCDDGLVCVVQELPTFTTTCRHCENVSLGGAALFGARLLRRRDVPVMRHDGSRFRSLCRRCSWHTLPHRPKWWRGFRMHGAACLHRRRLPVGSGRAGRLTRGWTRCGPARRVVAIYVDPRLRARNLSRCSRDSREERGELIRRQCVTLESIAPRSNGSTDPSNEHQFMHLSLRLAPIVGWSLLVLSAACGATSSPDSTDAPPDGGPGSSGASTGSSGIS